MTRPDIDAIISRLKGNDCLRPELCESLYCQDWRALVAYIRSLEQDAKILDWLDEKHPTITSQFKQVTGWFHTWTITPVWRDSFTRTTFREAAQAAMKDGF
jgi:hypothetical protein